MSHGRIGILYHARNFRHEGIGLIGMVSVLTRHRSHLFEGRGSLFQGGSLLRSPFRE